MTHHSEPLRLTSLLLVEERLLEAEYFTKRMARNRGSEVGYDLNAFLSAARSVTFLLQKEYSKVGGFAAWWSGEQSALREDPAARFFLELRNFSQKQGRISLVGTAVTPSLPGRRSRWSYRFAGTAEAVPHELLNRDVVDCCREHLAKLARVILRFSDRFPFHSCPARALTPDGVRTLGIDLDRAFVTLGYPSGWMQRAAPRAEAEFIELLTRHVDPVDILAIRRISKFRRRPRTATSGDAFGERLTASMVKQLELRRRAQPKSHLLSEFVLTELVRRDSDEST